MKSLTMEREAWSDPQAALDREFRRRHLSTVNALRRGKDPAGICNFDLIRQGYEIEARREVDEQAFVELLLRTDPRPRRRSTPRHHFHR